MGFMHDIAKRAYTTARKAMGGLFAAVGDDAPSRRELRLDANEFAVKRKLGRSFFTRQLNPNTRAARIMSLNREEWELAKERGWI